MEQNHGEGGDDLPPLPEQRERLRINSLVIPADEYQPIIQHELVPTSRADYRQLIGGLVQVVALEQPPGRMYMNEEGKLLMMPVNKRATMLLWAHNQAFRYKDLVVGEVLLVGQPSQRGLDTTVSEEFVKLLLEARQFHVEVKAQDDQHWHERGIRFDQWTNAYAYALVLGQREQNVTGVRVVPEP